MRPASLHRGQTLALLALTTLLLTLMVMMTVSIASRIRDRIELQMVADASAYSNAVATARSYNAAALLNRTMVSQWAAMCGIGALHAWGSMEYAYFRSFAGLVMELNEPNPNYEWQNGCNDGNGYYACYGRWGIDPNPRVPPATDCDDQRRQDLRGEHDALVNAGDARTWGNGYGQLDRGVVRQVRDLWQSLDDLGRVQVRTHLKLDRVLVDQDLALQLINRSGTLEPITVHQGDVTSNVALREVRAASPIGAAPGGDQAAAAHIRAMVQAIMGTRGDPFMFREHHVPFAFAQWMVATGRGPGVQLDLGNGAWIRYDWRDVTRNISHPGSYGQMQRNPRSQSLRSQPPTSGPEQQNNNPWDCNQCYENYDGSGGPAGYAPPLWEPGDATPWRGPALSQAFDGLRAAAWAGNLRVQYRAPNGFGCTPADSNANTGDVMSFVWYTVPVGPETPRHYTFGHHPNLDEDPGHHAGEIDSNQHWMGNNNTRNSVLPYSIGFAFPSMGERGAVNAWGQPKTPVLLSRDQIHDDPWNLLTGMRFASAGPGATLDLPKGLRGPVALGNAITYYHRTANGPAGGWREAPSFLNPFWRATLVPMDIDERTPGAGPGRDSTILTVPNARGTDIRLMLSGMGKNPERLAFDALDAAGWVGGQ